MQVKNTYRDFIAGLIGVLVCHAVLFAGSPADLLINQFRDVDSALAEAGRVVRPSKCDSAALARALETLLHQHDGLSAVALADGRGRVIAFSGYEAGSEALSQNVSRQVWYKIPRKTLRPYYGPLTENGRRFHLVWSRPVLAPSALGFRACEGVLIAYVNIAGCFKDFSRVYRRPFEIGRDTAVFYHTDNWQGGVPFEEEPFSIMGDVELTLRYTDAPLPEAAAADSQALAKDSAAAVSVQPAAETPGPQKELESQPVESPRTSRASMLLTILLIIGTICLTSGVTCLIMRKKKKNENRADEIARAGIIEEEKDAVRKSVRSDMYHEIRSRVGKSEVMRIEQEIREGMYREIEKSMMAGDGECLRQELKEKARAELLEEIRRRFITTENAVLREEARAKLLEELSQRLRKEVGGQLEMEALQALTRTMHSEVRAEHAKPLRERAMKDLDERIRQEVAIRERTMLLANARASLKESLEKEIQEKDGCALRMEARAELLAGIRKELKDASLDENPAAGPRPERESAREVLRAVLMDIHAALRKIDDSESLSSLAKTVDLLKSSQRDSPYFNLNAAQTSSMVEYLESVSCRLQGYIAEVKNGLGRLYGNVERLLRGTSHEAAGDAAPLKKGPSGTAAEKMPETETLVESE